MSLFDTFIVQPIFNVLILIYGLFPGGDFGIAVILFTILIRLLMWPLVKKQLHQTKVIRKIQPELKKIKAKAKGNKQVEAQLMMELYRERGVNPFGSIGLLLVQLPIFIALYQVIDIVTSSRDRIDDFTYGFLENLPNIKNLITNPEGFNESLLGIVNLADRAIQDSSIYVPVVIIAALAAIAQYYQTKQTLPQADEKKRLRDILKQQATGTEVDQAEVTAAVTNKMVTVLPIVTFFVGLYLPGALVLYFLVSSVVAVIQQHAVLSKDVEEMEIVADKSAPKVKKSLSSDVKVRHLKAEEAEIIDVEDEVAVVLSPVKKAAAKKKRKRR